MSKSGIGGSQAFLDYARDIHVWFSFIASRHLTPSLSIAFSALVRKSGSGKAVFNVVGFLEKKFKGEWRICFAGKAEKYNFNYDRFLLPDGD